MARPRNVGRPRFLRLSIGESKEAGVQGQYLGPKDIASFGNGEAGVGDISVSPENKCHALRESWGGRQSLSGPTGPWPGREHGCIHDFRPPPETRSSSETRVRGGSKTSTQAAREGLNE